MKKFKIYIQVLKRNKDYLNREIIKGTGKEIPKEGTISIHIVNEEVIRGETWETAKEERAHFNNADGLVAVTKDYYESNMLTNIDGKVLSGGILHSINLVFVLDEQNNEVYRNKDLLHPDFISYMNEHHYWFNIKE